MLRSSAVKTRVCVVEFVCALLEMPQCYFPRFCESRDRSKHTRFVKLIRLLARRNYFRKEHEEDAAVLEAENVEVSAVMERSRELTHLRPLDG